MTRIFAALLSALEAFIVAAIIFGGALVSTTLLWAVQYGLAPDWAWFARAAGDAWLLGHAVSLDVTLDPVTLAVIGAATVEPFPVLLPALGVALVVVLLAVRNGRRAERGDHPAVALVAGVITYALLAVIIFAISGSPVAQPSFWRSLFLPALIYGFGLVIGLALERGLDEQWMLSLTPLREPFSRVAGVGLRCGTAATALVLAGAGVVLAGSLVIHFANVVSLYEGLHAGVLGGAVLTLAQLGFVPNAVVWVASWLVGPGFAVGAGSSVSPLGSQLGPVPPVPLLGALPQGELAFGFVGIAVPVLAGFGVMLLARRSLPAGGRAALAAVLVGVVAGIQLGVLAWWSAGAAGPGRLQQVGPDPWLVALFGAIEVAVGALVGLFVASRGRVTSVVSPSDVGLSHSTAP